jgi:outer membrane protein assembly factor BamA
MGKQILVWATIWLLFLGLPLFADIEQDQNETLSWDAFPILMYDTDIGVGYGGRGRIVNLLKIRESFDLMLFNSSKGERTYIFKFSVPDFEIRQGTIYSLSFDLSAEYSKYLKQYYYGIGPDSLKEDLTYFTDEQKELQMTLGRGFSPRFVMELQYVIRNVHTFNVEQDKPFTEGLQAVGNMFSPFVALLLRYDTSDSRIHPQQGVRIILRGDAADKWMGNKNAAYYRGSLDVRAYRRMFHSRSVLAVRGLLKKISGSRVPLFEMPVLGGGSEFSALRGFQFNRYRDLGKILFNAEYRFPVWSRLGGNLFVDAGSVWPNWSSIRLSAFAVSAGGGLRYNLDEFVVRFDIGFSREGFGIYFNFDHIF